MVMKALMYKYRNSSPPLQPYLKRYASTYQEYQTSWNPYCVKKDALLYQFVTGNEETEIELIPDACLNALFELDASAPCAMLYGASLQSTSFKLKPDTHYFGFKPYSNLGIKSPGINMREMVDTRVDLSYVYPSADRLIADLSRTTSFSERIGIFSRFAEENLVDDNYLPTFVDYLAVMLCSSRENIVFGSIGQAIGYSERYCREKFKDSYGMSPKQYSNIIRFQNALKALVSDTYSDLTSLAVECGYFDQPHLTREFRRYTNAPPERYLKRYNRLFGSKDADPN